MLGLSAQGHRSGGATAGAKGRVSRPITSLQARRRCEKYELSNVAVARPLHFLVSQHPSYPTRCNRKTKLKGEALPQQRQQAHVLELLASSDLKLNVLK